MTQEAIIKHVQSMGCDATTLRDAAHEMCHALEGGALDWSRDGIHQSLTNLWSRGDLLAAEVRARAVERLVCEEFGVAYDSEHWLLMAWMETTKMFSGIPMTFFSEAVANNMDNPKCLELARQIIDIGRR